jgi:hypothetical protein
MPPMLQHRHQVHRRLRQLHDARRRSPQRHSQLRTMAMTAYDQQIHAKFLCFLENHRGWVPLQHSHRTNQLQVLQAITQFIAKSPPVRAVRCCP